MPSRMLHAATSITHLPTMHMYGFILTCQAGEVLLREIESLLDAH